MPVPMQQNTGTAAVSAIVAAIISLIATFSAHPFWGLILALVAIVLGGIGLAMAASPRVSGGMLSIASMVLGIFGLGASVLGMIGVIVF